MKKLFLFILLSLGLTSISLAGYLDDWTDDQLCGWMDNPSPPEHIVAEINKRGLSCGVSNNASASSTTTTNTANTDTSVIGELSMDFELTSYDVEFSEKVTEELLSETLKTDFDFSEFKIANNHRNLECLFYIEETLKGQPVEDKLDLGLNVNYRPNGPWTIAKGSLIINSGELKINEGSRWGRGGLSTDPKYLRDEVNLRLTEDGYLVGKLAFFEWVGDGEPPKLPIYPRLLKHKKSRPLNYKNAIKESAKLWIEVNDWSDGVLYLNCTMKDGKLDGKRTIWYKNGQIKSEVNYKNGMKEGKSRVWYENGQIKSETNYKDDLFDGKSTKWRENGQKESERNYIWGDLEGIQTSWYENGQIKTEENRKFGKYYGKRTNWYKDGQIMSEENYKDGNKEGKSTTWHEDGQIKSENNFKNGMLIVTE